MNAFISCLAVLLALVIIVSRLIYNLMPDDVFKGAVAAVVAVPVVFTLWAVASVVMLL